LNKIVKEDIEWIISQNIDWERFRNKSVLISGANGFIPGYMVDTLMYLNMTQCLNCDVICLMRNRQKAKERFKDYWEDEHFIQHIQDVCEPIEGKYSDFIIHAASPASPKYFKSDPVGTIKANTVGTLNMLEMAKHAESFLFLSSGAVYGSISEPPFRENEFGFIDPQDLGSCYAVSKACGEALCQGYLRQHQIPIKIVRPMHIYGPNLDLNDGRGFCDFVKNVLNHEDIELHSDGSDTRDFMYVADAIVLMFQILLNGTNGEAYNCGTGKETSIKELTQMLADQNHLQLTFDLGKGYRPLPNHRCRADMSKCEQEFQFHFHYTVNEGFQRMVESYGDMGNSNQ
jgi:nucleoside-diphosphate-sugar epimerase